MLPDTKSDVVKTEMFIINCTSVLNHNSIVILLLVVVLLINREGAITLVHKIIKMQQLIARFQFTVAEMRDEVCVE